MREAQHVIEVHAYPITRIGPCFPLFGKTLGFVENVRIVPINENAVHVVLESKLRIHRNHAASPTGSEARHGQAAIVELV